MRFISLTVVVGTLLFCAFARASLERVSNASTVERLDLTGLFARADLVLHARVASQRVELDARKRPETVYELSVQRTYWGVPLATRMIRVPGGVLADGSGMLIPGLPRLANDEELLLFLSSESKTGQRVFVGLAQGKYRVVRDVQGVARLERELTGLELVDARSGKPVADAASEPRELASLEHELAALANSRRAAELRSPGTERSK